LQLVQVWCKCGASTYSLKPVLVQVVQVVQVLFESICGGSSTVKRGVYSAFDFPQIGFSHLPVQDWPL